MWPSIVLVSKGNLTSVFDADREILTRVDWIMLGTMFTEFPALSVEPRVRIFWSATKTDD